MITSLTEILYLSYIYIYIKLHKIDLYNFSFNFDTLDLHISVISIGGRSSYHSTLSEVEVLSIQKKWIRINFKLSITSIKGKLAY